MKAVWIRLAVVTGVLLLVTLAGTSLALRSLPRLRSAAAADRDKPPEQLRRERAAAETVERAKHKLAAEQRRQMDEGDAVSGSTERLERYLTTNKEAVAQFRGKERAVLELLQERFEDLRAKAQAYEQANIDLSLAGFFAPASLPDRAAIAERRNLAQRWSAANGELGAFFRTFEARFRSDLEKVAAREQVDEIVRIVLPPLQGEQQLKVRDYDQQMATLALTQLDLFEAQWGAWHVDDEGAAHFTQPEAQARYNELQSKINAAATAQIAVQRQILAAGNRPPSGNNPNTGAAAIRGAATPARGGE